MRTLMRRVKISVVLLAINVVFMIVRVVKSSRAKRSRIEPSGTPAA